eukprot:3584256-Prymnesium_polylepis.1
MVGNFMRVRRPGSGERLMFMQLTADCTMLRWSWTQARGWLLIADGVLLIADGWLLIADCTMLRWSWTQARGWLLIAGC